jgi:hypothetical protein
VWDGGIASLVHLLGAREKDWVLMRIRILVAHEDEWVLGRIRVKRMSGGGESMKW